MNPIIAETLSAALGPEHVRTGVAGRVVATPPTTEALAHVLGLAYDRSWSVAVAGAGTWQTDDAPSQIAVSMRALDQVVDLRAGDRTATVQAGAPLELLRRTAFESGVWLPLDPPGRPDRTLGSLLATATAGPLRHGFGPVRDQVIGLTVVTGDGRTIRSADTAVNHPSDLDLVKLHVGGFGGFGVITECQLRLHLLPHADTTWVTVGDRDRLTAAARALDAAAIAAAAVELISPALAAEPDWVLAVRLVGEVETVANGEITLLSSANGVTWTALPPDRTSRLWNGSARAITGAPITLRLGVMAPGLDETLDLVIGRLGEGMVTASALSGALRWSGHADAEALRALRSSLAAREIPLTLERAPWPIRRAVGHFGAYREGMGGLVSRLRETFDPRSVLLNAVQATDTAA